MTRTQSREWTIEENDFIRRNYAKLGSEEIGKRLHRSQGAILTHAHYLGVSEKSRPSWSKEEDEFVRKHYGDMTAREISRFIDRSVTAIRKRARKLGVKYQQN